MSMHIWRQCNTLAVARNFNEEDLNIFKPRVDNRGLTNGVTGMQFPSYEYGLAVLYRIFGEHNFLHRLYSLLICILSAVLLFRWIKALGASSTTANIAVWALLFSPEYFFFGNAAIPDILSICTVIGSLYFFTLYHNQVLSIQIKKANLNWLLLSLFCVILAALTKLQYLLAGTWMVALVLFHFQSYKCYLIPLFFFGLLAITIPVAWYMYAQHLITISGLDDFVITPRSLPDFQTILSINEKNFVSDFPELLFGYPGLLLTLSGIFVFIKFKYRINKYLGCFIVLFCFTLIYHQIQITQMEHHVYYLFPYLLIVIPAIGYAGNIVFRRLPILATILVLAMPVATCINILPARWFSDSKGIDNVLFEENTRVQLENTVPKNNLVLMGPDLSDCKYFYFLRKKGFGFHTPEDLFFPSETGQPFIEDAIKKGVKYMYFSQNEYPLPEKLKPYLKQEIISLSGFSCYELTLPE